MNTALQYKARALDAEAENISSLRDSAKAEDRALFDKLSQTTTELSMLMYRSDSELVSGNFRQRISELNAERQKLETELAERSTEFRRKIMPVTVAAVRKNIPANAALLEWFRYVPFDPKHLSFAKGDESSAHYALYVLKNKGPSVAVDLGEARTIEASVHRLRSALSDANHGDFKSNAQELSDRLFKPVAQYLQGVDHLLVTPDGLLNLVPFAALLDSNGDYLAQRFTVTYLTSGRDLLRMDSSPPSVHDPMVVADPNFGDPTGEVARVALESRRSADLDRSGLIFRPLANTALEAENLKKLFRLDSSHVLIGNTATEPQLKQLHGPRILHIATHGFFLSDQDLTKEFRAEIHGDLTTFHENPLLRSGLALAGANERHSGATDDGILTALEAAQLDLHGTELVVLSACDSGIGDIQNGEGVYGLRAR